MLDLSTTTALTSQITIFQTLISGVISALMVIVGLFIKDYFERTNSRRNYIRDNGYLVHERLRDNLRGFLRSDSYTFLLLPKKVSKEDRIMLNISYQSFEVGSKEVFSHFNEITLYQQEFQYFEKSLLQDILKVSKLSIPRVQKVATEIEDLYDKTKAGDETLSNIFIDEFMHSSRDINYQPTTTQKSYFNFINEAHKKIFWIEVQGLLLKLEKEIERVVKLQL